MLSLLPWAIPAVLVPILCYPFSNGAAGLVVQSGYDKKARKLLWHILCAVWSLWALSVLVVALVALDMAVRHNDFGKDPGNNLIYGLALAALSSYLFAQVGIGIGLYSDRLATSLRHAVPPNDIEEYNARSRAIRDGSWKEREAAIRGIITWVRS